MLAVSPLREATTDGKRGGESAEGFSIGGEDFPDFSDENLLDCIDFDDLFAGINDGDVLPDLEMDPEVLADISTSGAEESEMDTSASVEKVEGTPRKEVEDKVSGSGSALNSSSGRGEEIVSKSKGEGEESFPTYNPPPKEAYKGKKSSAQSRNYQGKRKVKVDWTPELHRRFVQAVEQLGVDKAVPSRILELMGIDCLTRHNIASHLQKYRSHRKHLLAREAEAASWNQRRHFYGGVSKRDMNPWAAVAPTMGFPPPMTPMHHFRPLHVWGHPTMDQSPTHVWPKHLAHSPPPPPAVPTWPPAAAPPHHHLPDPSFWLPHPQRVTNGLTPGSACFPQPLAATCMHRFGNAPVPGIPPHAMYKVGLGIGVPTAQSGSRPLFDSQPSKESVDAAIGDVLSKPWLPLPLGLKPPSIDSVLTELQRQGIPKIPPTCA